MNYYPILVDIWSKRCVIVGGGEVAWRKARRLLDCGALVMVVSRYLGRGLREMKRDGLVQHIAADYQPSFLDGAFMVIAATNRNEINEKIALDARQLGLLVNIVDDPERGSFILPALVTQGDLIIAISTSGKSPALARKLKEDIASQFGPEYAILLNVLGEIRSLIIARNRGSDENKKIFTRLVKSPLIEQIRRKDADGAAGTIKNITGMAIDITTIREWAK